jgi:hypothetical protein
MSETSAFVGGAFAGIAVGCLGSIMIFHYLGPAQPAPKLGRAPSGEDTRKEWFVLGYRRAPARGRSDMLSGPYTLAKAHAYAATRSGDFAVVKVRKLTNAQFDRLQP